MDSKDYIEQIRKLQTELDIVTKECNEWKDKFERLLTYQKQPRLPVKWGTIVKGLSGDDLK